MHGTQPLGISSGHSESFHQRHFKEQPPILKRLFNLPSRKKLFGERPHWKSQNGESRTGGYRTDTSGGTRSCVCLQQLNLSAHTLLPEAAHGGCCLDCMEEENSHFLQLPGSPKGCMFILSYHSGQEAPRGPLTSFIPPIVFSMG